VAAGYACTLSLAGTIIPEPYVATRGAGVLQTMEFAGGDDY
jgi:hypothetical protein